MKKFLLLFFVILSAAVNSSAQCPVSHTATETSPNNYEIVFSSIPEMEDAQIDTTGNGVFDITATYVSGTTFTLTVSGNPTFFNILFGSTDCSYNNSLPVELVSFDAFLTQDNKIKVVWVTASELDNDYFQILNNGIVVLTYEGRGTYNGLTTYETYLDPQQGYNYLQLRQVDYDGTTTDSDRISVLYQSEEEAQRRYFDLLGRQQGTCYIKGGKLYKILKE